MSGTMILPGTMILEGLVTTTDPTGALHLAAMGPQLDEAERQAGLITRLVFRPFPTSQTAGNLLHRRAGVFHVTDDVLLLAMVVGGRLASRGLKPCSFHGSSYRSLLRVKGPCHTFQY